MGGRGADVGGSSQSSLLDSSPCQQLAVQVGHYHFRFATCLVAASHAGQLLPVVCVPAEEVSARGAAAALARAR